jgi:hypothetical protein
LAELGRGEKGSEIGTGTLVESVERFQQSRRVTEDFTSRTLAAIPSDLGKLYYVGSLRDHQTGRYLHEGLISIYSEASVQAALSQCHEELFTRILETPLEEQEADWRMSFAPKGEYAWIPEDGGPVDSPRSLAPDGLPDYLADLFCSNAVALQAVISSEHATSEPAA